MLKGSKASIIILNYNGRKYLGELLDKALESALTQTYRNVEVIFADNGSTDDSVKYVKEKYGGRIKVIELHKNYGFCLGNNLAVKHSSPEAKYLLFMNPDAVLPPDYLEKILTIMESDMSIGIATGVQASLNGSIYSIGGFIDAYGRSVEVDVKAVLDKIPSQIKGIPVLWVSGSAMLIRRKLFEDLGGFPSEFFMYHDEIDLCVRALFKGYKVVCVPKAVYYHKRGIVKSGKINWISWYFANRNRWFTTLRYLPKVYLLKSMLLALPVEFIINLVKSVRGERVRIRLFLRILIHLAKGFRRELMIREKSLKRYDALRPYIVDVPNPLIKEEYASRLTLSSLPSILRLRCK